MTTCRATLFVVGFFLLGCEKETVKEVQKQPAVEPAPTAVSVPKPVATESVGPGGKLVQAFFKNWTFNLYDEMWAQTAHSRDKEVFVKSLKGTPIHWRNLQIISEEPDGDDWKVTLSVEVTDIRAAFAACLINAQLTPADQTPHFMMSPAMLGIEKFETIKQTWKVVNLNQKQIIDVGAGQAGVERKENILNYVLDAADMEGGIASRLIDKDNPRETGIVTEWLTMAALNRGLSTDDCALILKEAVPLYRQGMLKVKELMKEMERFSGKDATKFN